MPGVAVCADVGQGFAKFELSNARVAIEGFGAVGRHAARFLSKRGATIVAVSDSRGATMAPDGLDPAALVAHKEGGQSVRDFPDGKPMVNEEMIPVDCDVWIPSARPDVITPENADRLRARVVIPGANIAVTPEAEQRLHERGVLDL